MIQTAPATLTESMSARCPGTVRPVPISIIRLAGNSLLWPAIAYFDFQDEYLLSFSLLKAGSEYDVMGQRIAAGDLNLLTTQLIGIARESSKIEQKSRLVFNDFNNEFFVGYEYNNGSDWDVRAHRVGNYTRNLRVVPDSLDFGGTLTNQTVNVTEITGKTYMYLTNSTDQPWLSFPSRVNLINFVNPTINLVASVDRSGLAVGNYSGNIRIEFEGIAEVVPVTMQIVNSAPNVPSNPTPASGAADQANLGSPLTVTMSWLSTDPDQGDQLTYDVYFSDNQSLVNTADAAVLVSDDQTTRSYRSATLYYGKIYYWSVIARDSHNQSTPGPVWQFTTVPIPAPVLVEYSPDPTNNKRPTLNWSAVADAVKYRIVIDDNADFSSPIADNGNLTSNKYTLSSDLPDGVIYWHVASIDSQGLQGAFSGSDDFTLDIAPPAIPLPVAYTPDPTKNLRPTLTWSSVSEAQNYHIQIISMIDFQTTLVDTFVSDTFYAATVDLPEGTIYWRLSSVDAQGNESAFSPPDVFRIDITAPAPVTGLAVMQENNGARLTWGPFADTHGDFGHFSVYRSSSPISNVSSMTPVSQSITNPDAGTYLDGTVAFGQNYYFAVTAVDHLGNENREVTAIGPFSIAGPVAVDDNYTVDEDDTLEINAPGILGNDIENDGDALNAILENDVSHGTLTLTNTGSFNYSPQGNYHGTDAFTYKAQDGSLDSNTATVKISINPVNDPPTISGTPPTSVNEDQAYSFTPTAEDVDEEDTLTFAVENKPSWANFVTATGVLTGTPSNADVGTTSGIAITVTDSQNASASLPPFDISVDNVNDAPTISGTPPTSVNEDQAYSFTPTAEDVDEEDTLTFAVENKPSWANFVTATGVLTGTPSNADVGTTSGIAITVTDSQNASASLPPFDISVDNVNDAPTISGTPPTSVNEDQAYSFTPTAEDVDEEDTLTFAVENKPSWANFVTATGVLTGTPSNADVGTTSGIAITVTDSQNASASLPPFDISVDNVNDAPTISGTPPTSVNEDQAYSFTPTAEDVDEEDTLTFAVENKPSWANFVTATGVLTGTPSNADVGTTNGIAITVTDSQNASASLPPFDISVDNVNDAPTISGTPPTSVNEDQAYSFTPTAEDVDEEDTLTFAVENKPSWANFVTATGVLTGTPSNADVGTTSGIAITVTDSQNASASLPPFDISVDNVNDAPTISGTPPTSVNEDQAYSFTPTAEDVDEEDTLTFAVENKPSWANFVTATGVLTGTPSNADVGTTSGIAITVTDSQNASASLPPFDISVDNVNDAPTISGTPPTSVNEDQAYSFTPTAEDVDEEDTLDICR